jgi:hypothetical protein
VEEVPTSKTGLLIMEIDDMDPSEHTCPYARVGELNPIRKSKKRTAISFQGKGMSFTVLDTL